MPRFKLRRLVLTLFAVSFTSFLTFTAWLTFNNNLIDFVISSNNNNNNKANQVKLSNYKIDGNKLPWFFANGTHRPNGKSNLYSDLYLFPNEANSHDDRIVNQLMFVPFNYENQIINEERKTKTVLLNAEGGGWNMRDIEFGQSAFLGCPVNACEIIGDSDRAETADAIIFKDRFQMPRHRRPRHQIWILYLLECPLHTQNFHEADNHINWTATYRHDSDIVTPYEKFVYYGNNYNKKKAKRNYAKGKTKKVAWFVSNCGAKNNRLQYARTLRKYIDVDIYGSCGDKICSRSRQRNCFDMLNRDYKFYLAFENSNCRDYITEKFYVNGLKNDVLPIAMGAHPEDYARSAPRRSFVHVDRFQSPQTLVEYLHKLDNNETLYNRYFEWKRSGEFINTYFWCRLCAMLHSNYEPKVYKRLSDWWSSQLVCKQRDHFFRWEEYLRDAFPRPV